METIDLSGRRGLVVGVANADSLAWSATRHFRNAGAELAMTYYNEKARSFVAPLAEEVQAQLLPCNVLEEGQLEAVFDALRDRWGRLDFVFHSIASARKEDRRAAWPTARASGSPRRCWCPATPLSAWPSSQSR